MHAMCVSSNERYKAHTYIHTMHIHLCTMYVHTNVCLYLGWSVSVQRRRTSRLVCAVESRLNNKSARQSLTHANCALKSHSMYQHNNRKLIATQRPPAKNMQQIETEFTENGNILIANSGIDHKVCACARWARCNYAHIHTSGATRERTGIRSRQIMIPRYQHQQQQHC